MKENLAALFAGALFGVGLAVSGMLIPDKVLNFLDVAGHWDPSLALVMGAAVAVTLPGYFWVMRKSQPLLAERFQVPTNRQIDRRLLLGASLFGLGWGLSGLCPAPALVNIATGLSDVLIFVVAMLAGMWLFHRLQPR